MKLDLIGCGRNPTPSLVFNETRFHHFCVLGNRADPSASMAEGPCLGNTRAKGYHATHAVIMQHTPYDLFYKVPLRGGVDLISRRCHRPKRVNTGVPMMFSWYVMSYCFSYELRIPCCFSSSALSFVDLVPSTRSDIVSLIVARDVKMLSWFDLLLCTSHTHTP